MSGTHEQDLGTLETMFSKLSMKPLTKSSAAFRASSAAIDPVITKPSRPHFNKKYPNITDPYVYDKMAFGDPRNWKRRTNNIKQQLTVYE